ncbi:MAG: STAS/SEC14 domain-containing protein [Bacteroidota bacterium]
MLSDFSFADDTIGYIIEGKMNKAVVMELKTLILEKMKEHDKINLYLEDAGIEDFSLDSVFIGTLFPHKHARRFNKVAMVTDRKWIHLLSAVNRKLLSGNFRNFVTERRMDAIAWITETH